MLRNKRFSRLPIPRKLVVMMMASSLLILVLGSTTILSLEIFRMRSSILSNVTILADIAGSNCAAPLMFNDNEAALETLRSLSFHKYILGARVLNTAGVEFASYVAAGSGGINPSNELSQEGYDFTFKELHLFRKIIVDDEPVGSISISYDLKEIYQRVFEYSSLMLILLIVMALLSRVLASKLQEFVSLPIQRLGATARRISKSKDYSLRASKDSDDETGDLVECFNEMLALVEVREQAMETKSHNLEEEVRLRTADLTTEKIKAEQATLSKSRFLANMSHEIRTPMIGVLGMSELLRQQDLTADNMQLVETIYNSGTALLTILNDLLDFSKIEAERLNLHPTATDLPRLLQEIVDLMTVNARNKGVEIQLRTPASVPLLLADSVRLRQVMLNLVGNAVKFTDTGSILVELSVAERDTEGRYDCRLQVKDSGVGIPQALHERIFEPFAQGDEHQSTNFSGTGLGLAIVRDLVALMNGSVTVNSLPGEGSTFTVLLTLVRFDPVKEPLHPKPNLAETAIDKLCPPPADGRNWRILLAEDNTTTQNLIKILLEKMSIDLLIVDNGLAAVELLAKEQVDLILMDCQMPKMNGFAATAQLRAMGMTTPIIALTAYARAEDEHVCLDAGMNDYLRKPFRQSELQQVLTSWLGCGLPTQVTQEDQTVSQKPS